jgi:hypothetical protein
MPISADAVVVFAGAGLSCSMPANLPMFDELRDEILRQLGLERYMWRENERYMWRENEDKSNRQKVAQALAPELFMLGLSQADIGVEDWLAKVLSGAEPNAAHHAVAKLAAAGSRVWTVNFDTLIEKASGKTLHTGAWPAEPLPTARLLKPHGSVGGKLIVTARQVIEELGSRWEERLRSDVRGRTVLFIGYRGRDLDFQPIWDRVLSEAAEVVWFDIWADGKMKEAADKRALLAKVHARGKLTLEPPAPLPSGAVAGPKNNPSWDFIAWCQDRHLITVDPDMILRLFDDAPNRERLYPPLIDPSLIGDKLAAKAVVQGMLGDLKGMRATYWEAARQRGYRWKAARGLGKSYVMHGGNGVAALLGTAMLLPPYGRAGTVREQALRMRLTAWSRTGRHRAVLRATKRLPGNALSVYLILRSEALRITGSLDEAATTAAAARDRAKAERHEVRLAHAAFQEALALLWAHRLDDARDRLKSYLLEYAPLAGNRWMAWANFVEAGVEVHAANAGEELNDRGDGALNKYEMARMRFEAEGLLDGVVSVKTGQLAAYRLTGDAAAYEAALARLRELHRSGRSQDEENRDEEDRNEEKSRIYHTQRNDFTDEAILNDEAEFHRCVRCDLDAAWKMYQRTAASKYPLQRALGHLGLALIQAERGESPTHAEAALREAEKTGCRLVADRSRELLAQPVPVGALRQVFFV